MGMTLAVLSRGRGDKNLWRPPPVDRHGPWSRDGATHHSQSFFFFFNPVMFLSTGRTGTKNGTETEGRANGEMASPGSTSCLQTPNPTLLPWSRGDYRQEPLVAVPGEFWPATDQSRG
jgi:hypothetical protein